MKHPVVASCVVVSSVFYSPLALGFAPNTDESPKPD
jgi:hypothetical protein